MGLKLPEALTADIPQSIWGKILSATPVVMTVVATMLAGLSSSEMTRAQYDRSLAAQQQSKAGDQWGYFQAKRLRSTGLKTARDMLQCTADVAVMAPAELSRSTGTLETTLRQSDAAAKALRDALAAAGAAEEAGAVTAYLGGADRRLAECAKLSGELTKLVASESAVAALEALGTGRVPELGSVAADDPALQGALAAVEEGKTGKDSEAVFGKISLTTVEEGLRAARERTRAFDGLTGPVNRLSDQCDQLLSRGLQLAREGRDLGRIAARVPADAEAPLRRAAATAATAAVEQQTAASQLYRDFTAARLRYAAARYDAEARLNQVIANLYEVQVRKNNISAERHHTRSQRFFSGMLAAQMAVIIATFAIAARQRNLLWGLAAAAGVAAVTFAVYVYLYV